MREYLRFTLSPGHGSEAGLSPEICVTSSAVRPAALCLATGKLSW